MMDGPSEEADTLAWERWFPNGAYRGDRRSTVPESSPYLNFATDLGDGFGSGFVPENGRLQQHLESVCPSSLAARHTLVLMMAM